MRRSARTEAKKVPPTIIRAAIYCRQSVSEREESAFTSIEAQREACEHYIQSQGALGWTALPAAYIDEGFSGRNLERPGIKDLLEAADRGDLDAVVVLKVDRLSRRLADFSQLNAVFEQRRIILASVTEHLNTSTPAGRMHLNMLLSFAEYERETIQERTALKARAARRKGLWTGGNPILGYDVLQKKLVVNAEEAERVRDIFKLYVSLGSTLAVAEELNERGLRMKPRRTRNGEVAGGPFTKHSVLRTLMNTTYVGKVELDGEIFDGKHEAIVDQATWDAVQDLLKAQRRVKGPRVRLKSEMLLQGIDRRCVCGAGMTPHYTSRGGTRYTYYVCQRGQKQGAASCERSRVAAGKLEGAVVEMIRTIGRAPELIEESFDAVAREVERLRPELEEKVRKLEEDLAGLEREGENLVGSLGKGEGDPLIHQRLGKLYAAIAKAKMEAYDARTQLQSLDGRLIDPEDLRRAIESFDPVWGELFPAERARILRLLIERVSYDGRTREVTVQFRPGGVRALAGEGEEKAKLA